jgi:hypothetical protein
MKIARIACVLSLSLAAAACGKKSDGAADGAASSSGPAVKGLGNSANDPTIVAAAKKAMACPWKGDSTSFDTDCADWKAWVATSDVYKVAAADATFINMIEDPDVKVRLLASEHLGHDSERKWVTDPALSGRVIAAAAAETQSHYGVDAMGKAVAHIDFSKTGNWAAAKTALEGTSLKSMERSALDWLLDFNETNAEVWDWVKSKLKDPDKSTAGAAVFGFVGLSTRRADACKVWADMLPDDRIGASCASHISGQTECAPQFDATLDAADGHAKNANATDSDWPYSMGKIAKSVKATDAQKKRAIAIITSFANNTHVDGYVRAGAIRAMYEADPAKGKALAAKFAKDPNSSIASAAKDVIAKK